MEYGTVELANNVRSAVVTRHNDDRSEIPRAHLVVKCFLDLGVADEDHVAAFKIEIADRVFVFRFKPYCCFASCGIDLGVEAIDILGSLLERDSTTGDEVSGG